MKQYFAAMDEVSELKAKTLSMETHVNEMQEQMGALQNIYNERQLDKLTDDASEAGSLNSVRTPFHSRANILGPKEPKIEEEGSEKK